MDKLQIIRLIVTREDASKLIDFLDALVNSLSRQGGGAALGISESADPAWKEALLDDLKRNGVQLSNRVQVTNFLEDIKKRVRMIPIITITSALPLRNDFLKSVSDSIEEEAGEKVAVCSIKDESILGGAILAFGGYIRDFSVKKDLDAFFTHAVG